MTKEQKKQHYEYQIVRRERLKKEFVEKLGGKCLICGYNRSFAALDFHHLDSNKKEWGIGTLIVKGYSEARIAKECEKCILLCCRCHREFHAGIIELPK